MAQFGGIAEKNSGRKGIEHEKERAGEKEGGP
jgi:hypothetical protein